MCGICGIIKFNGQAVDEVPIRQMMQIIKHRGPDDDGIFIHDSVGLGFVRLSILDLSKAGHQPMVSENKRYVIVFNGEIFNYIELREELKLLGYSFKTQTDTEVVIAAYKEWGKECQHKFNGMWAFAIYDIKKGSVFISRDRYGIKPFYYFQNQDFFAFASEIPPLLKLLPSKPKANMQAVFDYMVFNRTDQTEETFFSGIMKLQHGHCLKIDITSNLSNDEVYKESVNISCPEKWYDLRAEVDKNLNKDFNEKDFRKLFSDSIKIRLRSDVPVGVCLSGGLDSSSIVSTLLKNYNKADLNTFSAVYEKGQYGDESEFIRLYSDELKNMFYTSPNKNSLLSDLSKYVKIHAEPMPSTGPYAQYKVMELAQKTVVVTLDGQGADEMLAGYHYFFGFFFKDLFVKFRWVKLMTEMFHYLMIHKSLFGIKTFVYFLLPSGLRTKTRVDEKGYIDDEFINKYSKSNSIAGELYGASSLNEALISHFEYKLEHLLKWEDRNSMAFSLEARVPFLDYRLVEATLSLDGRKIIKNGMTKSLLRESMKGLLPEKIRLRTDKTGFDTPQDEWFRNEKFQTLILNILNSESFKNRGIVNSPKAIKLYHKHLSGKINIAKEIWKWIHLELWFREFID
ncbi:asparagine synthase (glutamine-hydrolyzing) [Bacteroidota bacterium]